MLVWKVHEGPYTLEDLPDDFEVPYPYEAFLLVMASESDDPDDWYDQEIWFESFSEAYSFKQHLGKSMKPVEVENL